MDAVPDHEEYLHIIAEGIRNANADHGLCKSVAFTGYSVALVSIPAYSQTPPKSVTENTTFGF